MHAVLLDFNGTMFFDTRFHMEAWSKIYHELHPEDKSPLASTKICGPCNDVILKNMAPWLTPAERQQYSEKKEALYREACRNDPASFTPARAFLVLFKNIGKGKQLYFSAFLCLK